MKPWIAGVASTIAVQLLALVALVYSGFIPANADATPSGLETWAARTSLDATLSRLAPPVPNPIELNNAHLLEGVRLFESNCAVCHGSAAGAEAASPIARGLYQKPPQLATDGVEDDPESESFWKIKHGIRLTGMPSFGSTLSDPEIWTLALFLKHMNKLPDPVQAAWRHVRSGSAPSS